MSMTPTDVRHWHSVYQALEEHSPHLSEAINEAYKEAIAPFRCVGLTCAGDDRAEQLVAALCRYMVESNPEHPDVKHTLAKMEENQ